MNKCIIIFIILTFGFCQQGTQRMKCENQHGMGDTGSCFLGYLAKEAVKKEKNSSDFEFFFVDAALLDCLVHNQKLRQCSKKPDYLPAW